ncbi:F-box/kelch-repeat protein At3g23880-like [Cornus florida]|uniref:F-box/kelch-repeat protein At3g23880-like n=1 Tax=Cornus florida TaxID=4283 RepID=UPI0028975F4C|nr:F-box/kelch-repeat protein At3g23880-like [Cornus florida]
MANKVKIHGLWGLVAKWFIKSQPPPPPPPPQPKLPILPNDIIYDILLLLPAKSLARSRCVCREWNNLLTGLDFLKRHLDHCHHRLVLSSVSSSYYHMSMDLEAPGSFVLTELDFPWKKRLQMIMGSCNGLLCILVGNNLFLWNPSTRKYKQLPPPSSCLKDYQLFYGFGYDESVDGYYNYKVVIGESYNIIEHGIRRSKLVEVYIRKTNSWRRIQDFPYNNVFRERGIFVNGFLHWFAMSDKDLCPTIASLDLAKEEFGEVMLPDFLRRFLLVDLAVLNGMLCVMRNNNGVWDVHAMKEYGVPESWFVLVTIPSVVWTIAMPFVWTSIRMPLYLMKNGELVMQISENKMLICDPRYGTTRNHIHTNFAIHDSDSVTYVESLESP